MQTAYSKIALTIAGIAVLYGAAAAQSDRAFENVSVLRAQKIELVDARGVHVLAQGRTATLKLKAGESERVLEP
jgi:hypothetical protein